ncbi:hypothetical protein ACLOJK_040987 [Asimina triloba]
MEDDTAFRIAWPMACASLTVVRSRWPADAASVGICMEIRGQKCRSITRLSVADRPRRGSAMNGQMGFEWQDLMAIDVRFVWAWNLVAGWASDAGSEQMGAAWLADGYCSLDPGVARCSAADRDVAW